jgi:hypothetical protein
MKLLLNRTSTNENCEQCEYALVDLTPAFAAWCIGRIAALNAEKQSDAGKHIHEKYYFRADAEFLNHAFDVFEPLDTAANTIDDTDILKLPDDFNPPEALIAAAECQQTIIREDAIAFFCYPKHADCGITTREISLQTLRSVGHPPIGTGHCDVCGHYGSDCTGTAA